MMTTIISIYNTTNKFTEEYNIRYMIKKFNLIECNLNYSNNNETDDNIKKHKNYYYHLEDYEKYNKNYIYDNNYDADDEKTTNE